jgi:hypothetical protein
MLSLTGKRIVRKRHLEVVVAVWAHDDERAEQYGLAQISERSLSSLILFEFLASRIFRFRLLVSLINPVVFGITEKVYDSSFSCAPTRYQRAS